MLFRKAKHLAGANIAYFEILPTSLAALDNNSLTNLK